MSIGRKEVLHVARLAELAVADADVPTLVEQLDRIVDFVAQLNEVPAGEAGASVRGRARPRSRCART